MQLEFWNFSSMKTGTKVHFIKPNNTSALLAEGWLTECFWKDGSLTCLHQWLFIDHILHMITICAVIFIACGRSLQGLSPLWKVWDAPATHARWLQFSLVAGTVLEVVNYPFCLYTLISKIWNRIISQLCAHSRLVATKGIRVPRRDILKVDVKSTW